MMFRLASCFSCCHNTSLFALPDLPKPIASSRWPLLGQQSHPSATTPLPAQS